MAEEQEDQGLTATVGPIELDVPQALGYYGGIGLALVMGMVEPPLAIFIAAVPLFKMLGYPGSPGVVRFVSQVLEGASKPVGGDGDGAVRVSKDQRSGGLLGGVGREIGDIWTEARAIAQDGSVRR